MFGVRAVCAWGWHWADHRWFWGSGMGVDVEIRGFSPVRGTAGFCLGGIVGLDEPGESLSLR